MYTDVGEVTFEPRWSQSNTQINWNCKYTCSLDVIVRTVYSTTLHIKKASMAPPPPPLSLDPYM